jgi:CRISPR-associated protein Cmr3
LRCCFAAHNILQQLTKNTKKPLRVIGTILQRSLEFNPPSTRFERVKFMYDNSTPIDGQVSSNRGNLTSSSKSNPCPVCGRTKDGDCRISRDGKMVLCHQNFEHSKTQQCDVWHFDGTTSDNRCGVYVFKEPTTKSIRPKQTRYWEYPNRDGSRLMRVVRVDDGKGNKKVWQEHWDKNKKVWVKGYGDVARASIPVYRYAEVQEAIAKRKPIYIAEGEPCVDLLWKLGFAATTNIGGGGNFRLTDTLDLQGAELIVIVLDRDKKGIEHAEKVAEHFPQSLWLYPFPESKVWENLPDDHGLDIADWIEHNKMTEQDIVKAIGDKKVFKAPAPEAAANLIRPPQFQVPPTSELGEEIEKLLESDLRKSQINLKISELAQKFRISSADVLKIYREREQEQEQEADRPDVATEIENLLSAHKSSIALTEVLPVGLAQPIEKLATMLNLRAECYLVALLTQVSSLFKVGTETILRRDTDWRCCPNYYGAIIAEASQLKTPISKAIIDRPMRTLRERAQKEFEQAQANYEKELNNWKATKKEEDRGPAPKPPKLRVYIFDKTTGEAIIYQQAEYPNQAMMYYCDELAGVFKSGNQYRGGKGSDEEDMLSFWSGTGTTVLRASGVRASVEGVGLSIFGTIQPDVLASLLKDCSDSNGKFARFDLVSQPLAVPNLPEDDSGRFDLTPMLADLYQKIDSLPAIAFEFDREAKEYHRTFTLACHRRRVVEPKQGLRAALGKMPEKVGKLATTIHTLNCVFNGQQVTNHIPRSAVEAAVKFVKFAADQVASLYTEFSDRTALAPNLTKILLVAERQGGKISTREAQHIFRLNQRPTAQTVREWFSELQEMKHGEVTTVKKSVFFILTTTTRTTVAQNPDTERVKLDHSNQKPCTTGTTVNQTTVVHCGTTVVTNVPQSESLPDKDLTPTVVPVVHNSPPSEKSESLLLSYLTEPEEFAEQIRKAIANFDRSLAIQVWDGLKAKVKRKLREEVKSHLTARESENFKVLVTVGFLLDMRVKYVGDSKYAEQYEGLELEVYSMDEYAQITCRKPNGYLTTRMKPEELQKL